jgi:tetratricopeptide (TPR) repeat protein
VATKADEQLVKVINAESSMGVNSLNTGKHNKAIECFSKVIKHAAGISKAAEPLVRSQMIQACLGRGSALMLLAQFKPAITDFTAVIEIEPACIDAYKRRGLTKCAMGDNHAAVKDLDLALIISQKAMEHGGQAAKDALFVIPDMDIYRQRAVVHHRRQDYSAAVHDLQVRYHCSDYVQQ